MAAPYTKNRDSDAIDDGWTITDGDGNTIAHLDTELLADTLLAMLLGDSKKPRKEYPADTPLGTPEPEDDKN